MVEKSTDTRLELITAAGRLIAEYGLEGASVRAIAEKAGTNLAAIHYHFGSKDNLFIEAMKYAAEQSYDIQQILELQDDERLESPEGIAEIIYEVIEERFQSLDQHDGNEWCNKLLIRNMIDPSPALKEFVTTFYRPRHKAFTKIIQKARPDLTKREAEIFVLTLDGQCAFYTFARSAVLMFMGKKEYEKKFLEAITGHIVGTVLHELGLPIPEKVTGKKTVGIS
jgi:TetR/AcrR family transcriptional regulator, regulator of cefoperazone and chloramphenicol sensitivity